MTAATRQEMVRFQPVVIPTRITMKNMAIIAILRVAAGGR